MSPNGSHRAAHAASQPDYASLESFLATVAARLQILLVIVGNPVFTLRPCSHSF
jgi:hypothetical protein